MAFAFTALLAQGDLLARHALGEQVTYTPSIGAPVTVQGIYDEAFQHVEPGAGQAGVTSTSPAVFLHLADLPTDPEDDAAHVTARGITYYANEIRKDGEGGVLLMLRRTS